MSARAQLEKQALAGLATEWEAGQITRCRLLLDKFLLKWPKPELIGVPSYASAALNYDTLEPLFRLWAANIASPKAPRVTSLVAEVGGLDCSWSRIYRSNVIGLAVGFDTSC